MKSNLYALMIVLFSAVLQAIAGDLSDIRGVGMG